ncbi:hypothetical protein K6T12_15045, partial [Marinobacterium sp. CAU 1594]|nr:hypothetical protein [Marinobacterium arenosum]
TAIPEIGHKCSASAGMGVHVEPESVFTFRRNGCSRWAGICNVILDGIVNPGRHVQGYPQEYFMEPSQIAEAVYFLTQQPSQAWTFELDLRAFGEKW